ncbi:MAG: hypothetical protein ACREUT_20360 [Steroidobacteraceae bacterium]
MNTQQAVHSITAQAVSLKAAADYLGSGAVEVPIFEREITDMVRRSDPFYQRIPSLPATGHPHRYFEQLAIATATATDPRNLSQGASGPTRVERPAFIKAVTAQTNLSLFDKEVTQQQGQFASVVAKDVDDIVNAVIVKACEMTWAGSDTSLAAPTTYEWVGLLTQITQQAVCAVGVSIIDTLKSEVAAMVANVQFKVKPTGIAINPVLGDLIDREAKAAHIELGTMEIVAGVKVKSIATQAGELPLIPTPYIPTTAAATAEYGFGATPAGIKGYYAVILSESELERPVISGTEFNPKPRLYQLGLIGNLAGQFVALVFDALIAKGFAYAHSTVQVLRP